MTLRLNACAAYAGGRSAGPHFEHWARENLHLGQSSFAGRPMELERDWQAPIMYEALAVAENDDPYWRMVAIIVPRKCAKTTTLGAYAVYQLDEGVGEPEILLAAGSDKQAGRLFNACAGFVRRSPDLRSRLIVREHVGEIARTDGGGKILRLSSEGDTQHGLNPSLVVIDELAWWRSNKLQRSWGALTTADGARSESQVFAITTEGESSGRADTILGQLVDENERVGDVERIPGCTISRDHDSRVIVFRFHAVDAKAADPRPLRRVHAKIKQQGATKLLERERRQVEKALLASVMPANPASWITAEYILRQALSAKVMPSDFLQLHANVAADMQERWITPEMWMALKAECDLQPGDTIAAAVDAALSHDSTAVTWAHKREDDRVCIHCYTWGARQGIPVHEHVEGGRIRNEPVKAMLRDLAVEHHLDAVLYDPRYFADAAMELSDEGMRMIEFSQQSRYMRDAETQFHTAVLEGTIAHTGDAVLATHVSSAIAEKTEAGWRIRKMKNALLDALTSAMMVRYHAQRFDAGRYTGPLVDVLA